MPYSGPSDPEYLREQVNLLNQTLILCQRCEKGGHRIGESPCQAVRTTLLNLRNVTEGYLREMEGDANGG